MITRQSFEDMKKNWWEISLITQFFIFYSDPRDKVLGLELLKVSRENLYENKLGNLSFVLIFCAKMAC